MAAVRRMRGLLPHYCKIRAAVPVHRFSTIPDPDPGESELFRQQLLTPVFVHPVAIGQLEELVRRPTLPRLVASASFLKSQLPARLENHVARLAALPAAPTAALRSLLDANLDSKRAGLQVAMDWRLVPTDDLAGLRHFESHLSAFREHLELEVGRLMATAQSLSESKGWWSNRPQVRWLARLLDLSHWYLLSARVMLTQHSAALATLERGADGGGGKAAAVQHYHEAGHASTVPAAPYMPPHQQLAPAPGTTRAAGLIQRHTDVCKLLQAVAEDCRAFCVEKNSAAPDVSIEGSVGATATLIVPYVEFMVTELLKNAMQAVVDRYGAWDVDDAPPVLVHVEAVSGGSSSSSSSEASANGADRMESSGSLVRISVTDSGNGIPASQQSSMYDYFHSTARPASTLYGYSRNHGNPFQGIGVGVPLSRVYAHFMGGSLEWETASWQRHTTAVLTLPRDGFTF